MTNQPENKSTWNSPIDLNRWKGYRPEFRGIDAFKSLENFEKAQIMELDKCLEDHEKETLARLLTRGNKSEIEIFIRGHGANPIFPSHREIDHPVGVAKADVVSLEDPPSEKAVLSILNGEMVHVLFQAGEATRFGQGPLYDLNPLEVAEKMNGELSDRTPLDRIAKYKKNISDEAVMVLTQWGLGPKQPVLIRAALRRLIRIQIKLGRMIPEDGMKTYQAAVKNQKILIFVNQRGGAAAAHRENMVNRHKFYGFDPANLITIEQQLVHGMTVNEKGEVSLMEDDWATDAAGHLYALLQAARPEDFTFYRDSGRPVKSRELDALAYLGNQGGKYLSIVRINDMDRHSTEIINSKAVSYALDRFAEGYANVIEGVANPQGQKGGTGTTFNDPESHVLTETHENSFPALSRAFEKAMKAYLEKNQGQHPAYNAMRQLSDLYATRHVLKEYGGRIVFVPRQKEVKGEMKTYLGVDMPMGDLSLLEGVYRSRMFQLSGPDGKELLIHDMKTKKNLDVALRTIERQLQDPDILAAAEEVVSKKWIPFGPVKEEIPVYGAPTPEFD